MPPDITERTRVGIPMTVVVSVVASLLTGSAAATAAVYSLRDGILERLHKEVEVEGTTLRAERAAELRYYVSKEAFSEWKSTDRVRQDQQYYSLLNAIERLSSKVGNRP